MQWLTLIVVLNMKINVLISACDQLSNQRLPETFNDSLE